MQSTWHDSNIVRHFPQLLTPEIPTDVHARRWNKGFLPFLAAARQAGLKLLMLGVPAAGRHDDCASHWAIG